MNSFNVAVSICATAKMKKNAMIYFSDRKGISNHREIVKFFPIIFCPRVQSDSLIVPMGQSQLQKAFFRKKPITTIATKIKSPAGCMLLMIPVDNQYFKLISALMGKNPSAPGGRLTAIVCSFDVPQLAKR